MAGTIRYTLLFLVSILIAPLAVAAPPAHEHGDQGQGALTLDHGNKWPTDAPLRKGMSAIRSAVAPHLPAVMTGRLKAREYQRISASVSEQVAFVVANCKLNKEADGMLHLILADLIAGGDAMAANAPLAQRREGALRVAHALDAYGTYFDHPGWVSLETGAHAAPRDTPPAHPH